jgi:hypothetical protein
VKRGKIVSSQASVPQVSLKTAPKGFPAYKLLNVLSNFTQYSEQVKRIGIGNVFTNDPLGLGG